MDGADVRRRGGDLNVAARFLARARADPSSPAVSDETTTWSRGELERRAAAVASRLLRLGVERDEPVVVAAGRSCDAVAAVVGVALAGAAYVPVDPAEPQARVSSVLEGAGARLAVVDEVGAPVVAGRDVAVVELPVRPAAEASSEQLPRSSSTAYILFTSGSTGRPKGVGIGHESLDAFLAGSESWAGLDHRDVVACFHALTFDISLWEIWGALSAGAHLVLVPRAAQFPAASLLAFVRERRVTRLCQTPTALRELSAAAAGTGLPPFLRSLYVAGERLDFRWLRPFAERLGLGTLEAWNLYGPTETTIYATGRLIRAAETQSERRSLIGRALPHVEVAVVAESGDPAGPGEEGEIWISGIGVGTGYRGTDDAGGFCVVDGRPVFRTGDVGRMVDGDIEFVGRRGGFVKIRGYRVEPDEVASAIRAHSDVEEAAVVDVADRGTLAALVVVRADAVFQEIELRRFVAQRLPTYMRPSQYVCVPALPRLPSAKLDREAARAIVQSADPQ